MDRELKELAEKAGLTVLAADGDDYCGEVAGSRVALAEFAALIAERCANEAVAGLSLPDGIRIVRDLAARWRSVIPSK